MEKKSLDNLKDLVTKALNSELEVPINLIDLLRDIDKSRLIGLLRDTDKNHQDYWQWDELVEDGVYEKAYSNNLQGFRVIISTSEDRDSPPYISDSEPDYTTMAYVFNQAEPETLNVDHTLKVIFAMFLADCPNCCNALDYLTLSNHGLLTHGNVSSVYHS